MRRPHRDHSPLPEPAVTWLGRSDTVIDLRMALNLLRPLHQLTLNAMTSELSVVFVVLGLFVFFLYLVVLFLLYEV